MIMIIYDLLHLHCFKTKHQLFKNYHIFLKCDITWNQYQMISGSGFRAIRIQGYLFDFCL